MADSYNITLKNCGFFARHGLHEQEEFLGQRFFVDAELEVLFSDALEADELSGTVDYGVAFNVIEEWGRDPDAVAQLGGDAPTLKGVVGTVVTDIVLALLNPALKNAVCPRGSIADGPVGRTGPPAPASAGVSQASRDPIRRNGKSRRAKLMDVSFMTSQPFLRP